MAGINATLDSESWVSEMEQDASGDFVRFEADEEKVLKMMGEPVKGVSKFTYQDGSEKTEWVFEVLDGENPKIMKWAISSKPLLQQIVAIMRKEKLARIAGCTLRVTAAGEGKNRRWFVKILEK